MDFRLEGSEVISEFSLNDKYQGFDGITHGGVIASLLAECMGTVVSVEFERFLGKRIQVDFIRVLPTKGRYILRGRRLRVSGREIVCEAEIVDHSGNIYAKGEGVFVIL